MLQRDCGRAEFPEIGLFERISSSVDIARHEKVRRRKRGFCGRLSGGREGGAAQSHATFGYAYRYHGTREMTREMTRDDDNAHLVSCSTPTPTPVGEGLVQ